MEMKKTKVKMNKPIYLGFSILEVSKTLMHEFWYGYMKPNYAEKAKLCYTDTDSFIAYIKAEDSYEDIVPDVDKWFDTSNYIVDRLFPISENKKVLCKFKDELGGRIMTECVGIKPKTYSFLIDDFEEKKKNKRIKKCVVKTRLRHQSYKDCLLNKETILKKQQRFKREAHNVYTEEVNKIALRRNNDKRVWASDGITSYPYGYKGRFA